MLKQPSSREGYCWYKIGYSRDIRSRVDKYTSCNTEISLVGTRPGEPGDLKVLRKYLRLLSEEFQRKDRSEWYETNLPEEAVKARFGEPWEEISGKVWEGREKVFNINTKGDFDCWLDLGKGRYPGAPEEYDIPFVKRYTYVVKEMMKGSSGDPGRLLGYLRDYKILEPGEAKRLESKIYPTGADRSPVIEEKNPEEGTIPGYGCIYADPSDLGDTSLGPVAGRVYPQEYLERYPGVTSEEAWIPGRDDNNKYYIIIDNGN